MAGFFRGESREDEASRNAGRLSDEINALKSGHWKFPLQRDYKAFFAHAREISELFKTLKPLRRDDRERLWNEFSRACEQARIDQNNEWEARKEKSRINKDICLNLINRATHSATGARDRSEVQKARDEFEQAHSELRERSKDMLNDDRQECWDRFKEGKRKLYFRKKELQDYSYSEAKRAVADAMNALKYKDNPYEVLDEIKAARARTKGLYLNKEQAQWIRKEFDEIWEGAISRIQERKREKQRRREEWQQRQRAKIERWEARIDRLQDVVRSLEQQIDHLEDERSRARTAEYADKCWEWIRQKQYKISDIESTIRELERKISDVRRKIGY